MLPGEYIAMKLSGEITKCSNELTDWLLFKAHNFGYRNIPNRSIIENLIVSDLDSLFDLNTCYTDSCIFIFGSKMEAISLSRGQTQLSSSL